MIKQSGDTLIVIPCWWDGSGESLLSTILFQRPDLLEVTTLDVGSIRNDPVSLNPPLKYFRRNGVPGVGELMLASFPESGKFIDLIASDNPWWLGEKYDGVRVCWNPDFQQLYTRAGSELMLTQEQVDLIPDAFIDGEAWFGRGSFTESQQLVHATAESTFWQYLRIIAFDVVSLYDQPLVFEERYKNLTESVEQDSAVQHVLGDGGEGVILRACDSAYESGRSSSLVKIKASRWDKEAMVENVGEDSTIQLRLANGSSIEVPPQNIQVTGPYPKEGDVVTFTFDSYSRGDVTPVNPFISRVRFDISWEQVLYDFALEVTQPHGENVRPLPSTAVDTGKHRIFFEEFARSKNKDPLDPDTWYNTTRKEIEEVKGGQRILSHLKGGYVKALERIFPDVHFEISKFDSIALKGQDHINKQRRQLVMIAQERQLDPLLAETWYNITTEKSVTQKAQTVLQHYDGSLLEALHHLFPEIQLDETKFTGPFSDKVCKTAPDCCKGLGLVLSYYDNSLPKALQDLFPNIGIEKSKFNIKSVPPRANFGNEITYAEDETTDFVSVHQRKLFFEKFAKKNRFDPLVARNWYLVPRERVMRTKGAGKLLYYYNNSLSKALAHLFPTIGLIENEFCQMSTKFWSDSSNRKKLFEGIAKASQIDPLLPDNWYRLGLELELVDFKVPDSVCACGVASPCE